MIETMRQHSQIDRANMLEWLRHCDEQGEAFPSDEAIADRFQYPSVEAARTLLADLADRGEISVRGTGSKRTISISPVKPMRVLGTERRLPKTITKPKSLRRARREIAEEEGAERIMEIIRRGREPDAPAPTPRLRIVAPQPVVAPEPVSVAPEPEPVAPRPIPVAARVRWRTVKQIAFRPSADAMARLEVVAASEGKPVGRKAREMLEAALLWTDAVDLPRKPVVPVAVLIASSAAGKGLHEFVADLIERGLIAWQQEAGESVG